jgi:hypothetical protein
MVPFAVTPREISSASSVFAVTVRATGASRAISGSDEEERTTTIVATIAMAAAMATILMRPRRVWGRCSEMLIVSSLQMKVGKSQLKKCEWALV